jgi:hypothetical protein
MKDILFDVGRNKAIRALARIGVSGIWTLVIAGNARPEFHSGLSYSGLHEGAGLW